MSEAISPTAVNAARDVLLGGTVDIETLAAARSKSVRTIEREIARGLPLIKIGNERRFNLESVRDWLLSHERKREPVRRGRPSSAPPKTKTPHAATCGADRWQTASAPIRYAISVSRSSVAASTDKDAIVIHLQALDRMRLQRGAEHLHNLGARATAEFLAEVANSIGGMPAILAKLNEYQLRLSPQMLRMTGGDRFPANKLRALPRGNAR